MSEIQRWGGMIRLTLRSSAHSDDGQMWLAMHLIEQVRQLPSGTRVLMTGSEAPYLVIERADDILKVMEWERTARK